MKHGSMYSGLYWNVTNMHAYQCDIRKRQHTISSSLNVPQKYQINSSIHRPSGDLRYFLIIAIPLKTLDTFINLKNLINFNILSICMLSPVGNYDENQLNGKDDTKSKVKSPVRYFKAIEGLLITTFFLLPSTIYPTLKFIIMSNMNIMSPKFSNQSTLPSSANTRLYGVVAATLKINDNMIIVHKNKY